ncbi:MAG: DUF4388 domain-containing protein [bacterium]|nr:DUF4388 domain-containing protein [bacterium]
MLSEKGTLKDTPVLKLLLTIFEQGLTGILYVKQDDVLKVLYFSRGKIIWAISNSDDDKLETILLSKGLADPDTMQKAKMESRVSESIGKLMVEKGLITLEELIDSSKDQLRRIIISVLKWRTGGFQFVKDAPPERLLSLDLNVTDFIIDYIVEELDISDIWKEIGSLQLELIKNPDEEKLSKYNLSEKQTDLLKSFDGEKKLESVLSRHSGGHRESLLKVIYFFLMAELLIKKEFDLSDASIFDTGDTDGGSDFVSSAPSADEPFETYKAVTPPKPVMDDPMSHFRPPSEDPPFDLSEESGDESLTEPDERPTVISPPPFAAAPEIPPADERKRVKLFNAALVLVFLVLVFSGIILLLLPWLESDTPANNIVKKVDTPDIITIQEPSIQQDNAGSNQGQDQGNETGTDDGNGKTQPPEEKKPEEKKDNQKEKKNSKEDKQKDLPKKTETVKPALTAGKSALAYFREGNFITAGDIWKRELIAAGMKYSIMLELDCLKESVVHAYNRMKKGKDFFILNRRTGKKSCYLVLWGKFKNRKDATNSIKSVPNYYWKQRDPPEIVELKKYFRP